MKESVEAFIDHVAAATPTPGGGTVSAVCGALSAALSRMVVNLAVGKAGYEAAQADLAAIDAKGKDLQRRFLDLADEDAKAFEGVMAAMRLPKTNDGERAARKAAMQSAFQRATEVPMDTIRACLEALDLAKAAAETGNRNAITDAGVAALLAQAAMRGAALNVKINLAAIADHVWRDRTDAELEALLQRGAELAHATDDLVASKM